ncbi:hypothetical protein GCM10016234_24860 [Tianweitania populi]|uniref:BrnT family toxin n=2 Tax=Tianweitania populi TaxID=1607949 RepID=A0A8J3GMD5_9HYPH|nr:hypothetical protein GCM10016234_24860 [Tianweitania populi]
MLMEFEWDENKRDETLQSRRVDILYAAGIFEGDVVTSVDQRSDYGEVRLISVGMIEDECFVVLHTQRGHVTRLITAWKGGRNARRKYQACYPGRTHQDEKGG